MDRTIVTSEPTAQCTPGIRFQIATPAHDPAIRRLLRETVMRGRISVSMEHEPSHFAAAAIAGSEHQTMVAFDNDKLIATGSVSCRRRYINGTPMRVGYLSGLRVAESHQGRPSLVRRGYEFLHHLHEQGGPQIYLTSIVSDNDRARRLLERGLKGMPTYRFLGDFVTLLIRRRENGDFHKPPARIRGYFGEHGLQLIYGSDERVSKIVELLNADLSNYQFTPVWSTGDLTSPGLPPADFRLACRDDGIPVACAALWDQRAIRQTVIRGYSPVVRRARWFINIAAALLKKPRLPAVGQPLSLVFISHLACDPDHPEFAEWFIDLLHGPANTRKIANFTIGFDARDPRLAHLRKVFHPVEYASRLYAVHWEDGEDLARSLDNRLLAPEVGLL